MKLNKGFTLFEALIVAAIIGIIGAAILPRLHEAQEYNKEKQKIQKEMPKTFEYVTTHDNLELVKFVCKKDNSDKMFSDEVCYNRMKTFDYCKNDFPFTVENEKQVETIFNNCKLKKEEILMETNNANNIETNEISDNLQSKWTTLS